MRAKTWGSLALVVSFSAAAQSDPTLPPLVEGTPGPRRDSTVMHFLAHDGDEAYRVSVGDQACETPCTLALKPGPTKVHLVGPGERDIQVVVPHLTAQVRVKTGPPGWYQTAGIVMIPSGIAMAASMWALGFACGNNGGACVGVNFAMWPILGVALVITGSVMLGLYNKSQPPDANRVEILDAERAAPVRLDRLALAFVRDGLSLRF